MACTCSCGHHSHHEIYKPEHLPAWKQPGVLQFGTSAVFFIVGIVLKAAGEPYTIPIFYGSGNVLFPLSPVFFIAAWLAAGKDVLKNAASIAKDRQFFDENFLMATATIGAFILGEWTEGAAVMLFYNLGELFQEAAVHEARRSITELMDLRPEFVRLYGSAECSTDENDLIAAKEVLADPESVAAGTLIVVKAGEKVPLDGILEQGSCSFDTASMTGESIPRFLQPGDTVLAGFVNKDGLAVIRTTATAGNTAAAKMLALVEHAQNRKAKAERFISAFARVYTPIVTVSAVLLAFVPPLILSAVQGTPLNGWTSFIPWVSRGLVFLVISCPCAFVISVPLGYFGGLGGAAKKGILIKGADFLDALAKAGSVIFDKTGTLTEGVLTVTDVIPAEGVSRETVLRTAYLAEYHSNHPIAAAVKKYAAAAFDEETMKELAAETRTLSQYTETAGEGIHVRYRGSVLQAGSIRFILGAAAADHPLVKNADGIKAAFSCDGQYMGCLVCSDTVRKESPDAITALRNIGISYIEMLTGDTQQTGEKIAGLLGLDRCSSGLLPDQKVARFEHISAERKVKNPGEVCIFVGDGINDAPVLARADAGVAMGAIGSDAAIEAADIVLMNDNPLLIAQGIESARFTRKIVKQNIILAFAVKAGFLLLGAAGLIGLWTAVFADVGVALLAVCNSIRARK